jgi:hypothetical protein
MTIASVGTLGTGANSTSATTSTFNTATNTLAAGDFGILIISSDNLATADGQTNNHTAVSGGTGTWTKLGEYTNSPTAAASDGCTVSVWLFEATGTLATGTTITQTYSAAIGDDCSAFWKFTKAAGTTISQATALITSEVTAANDFGSSSFSGLSLVSHLYLRGLGKESNSTTALTPTTLFTEITGTRSRNNASAVIVRGEFKISVSVGETSNPTLAVSGDSAGLFLVLVEVSTQTLTPTLFTNTASFFAPTVAPQPVTLLPARYNSSSSFFAATVFPQAVTLLPSLFSSVSSFFAATVTQSQALTQTVTFVNTSSFFSPALSLTLLAARYNSASSFFTPVVSPGAVTLTQTVRLNNSSSFFVPVVSPQPVTLTQTVRFDNSSSFFPATVSLAGQSLAPSRLDNLSSFFSAVVSFGPLQLTQTARVNNSHSFFSPIVALSATQLLPGRFDNLSSIFLPNIGNQYPNPENVLAGIRYGASFEFVGTATSGVGMRFDLASGRFIRILNKRLALSFSLFS